MIDKTHVQISEHGFVLPTVLVVLSLVTLLAITSTDTARLQQTMAFNMKQRTQALQTADLILRQAENKILQQVSDRCTCTALKAEPDKSPAQACHEQLAPPIPSASAHEATTTSFTAEKSGPAAAWHTLSASTPAENTDWQHTARYKIVPLPADRRPDPDNPDVMLLFRLTAQARRHQIQTTVQSQYQIVFQYCRQQSPQGRRLAWHEQRP